MPRDRGFLTVVTAWIVAAASGVADERPQPAGEAVLLSERGCGRATAYAEANRIVTRDGKTHVAWLDSEGGKFLVRARTLDLDSGAWSPAVTVGEAHDNHGGPALTLDRSGRLHIVYGPHHHPMRYRYSTQPGDVSSWSDEQTFGSRTTYPTLLCGEDDTLYVTCRESSRSEPWGVNLYRKEPDGTWTGPKPLLAATHGGYSHFQESLAWGPDQRTIHLSCRIHERQGGFGHTVGYLKSEDGGETWTTSRGEAVELPATAATVDVIARRREPWVEGGVGLRCGSIAIDPRGRPWILWTDQDRLPVRAWLSTPDGEGGWERIEVSDPAGGPGGLTMPGGIVFARGEMTLVLTRMSPASIADEALWGHPSSEVVRLRSSDRGATFRVELITEPDPEIPHWLPSLERPTGHHPVEEPAVLWTDGGRGPSNRAIVSNRVWFTR